VIQSSNEFIKNPIYLSFTGLSDFLKCPRSYYLKNLYKDSKRGFKLQIITPHLTLGSTVHDSIKWFLENKSNASRDELEAKFRNFWLKYQGRRGGFETRQEEASFGQRGIKMLNNFWQNAKILESSAKEITFPKFNLVENVILIGNFDFVGEFKGGTLHIIDFKTGAKDEESTLQLYIYAILAEANFKKRVSKASFWYLDRDDSPREIVLDPLKVQLDWLVEKAKEVKKALEKQEWVCVKGEELCRDCRDYQAILEGKGEWLFSDFRYKKEIYYLQK